MKRSNSRGIRAEWLGLASMNFAALEVSAARQAMYGSHIAQHLTIDGATVRKCQSGVERQFGKATFHVKMPMNGEIRAVIDKYPNDPISPVTTVIYENMERGIIDHIDIPYHHCLHNHFGFRYKRTENVMRLTEWSHLREGTILADSPSVTKDGDYMPGAELNVVYMSHPGIIEDGALISETGCKIMTATGFEKRHGSWGHKYFPLGLYTKEGGEYQPHPNVGETIRPDGLLFAMREYNPITAGINMAADMLTRVDHVFDKRVYGIPNAKVVDVEARTGLSSGTPKTPVGMDAQAKRYHQAQAKYYSEIERRTYGAIGKTRRTIAPKLHRLIVEGLVFKNNSSGRSRTRQIYNLQPLDEWRVSITFEYKMVPNVGSKITDTVGGKSVIVRKMRDEDMPTDQWGRRAHVITDGNSTIKRLNPGRLYEQWFNAQGDQMQRRLIKMKEEAASPSSFYAEAWDLLLRFYTLISPLMVDALLDPDYKGSPKYHVDQVIKEGVHYWLPTHSPITLLDAYRNLSREFPLEKGPVTFRGHLGHMVTSRRPVIVASVYFLLLEKTGDEWSAVSSTKLNTHGIPAKPNKNDKYSAPGKTTPVRLTGEAEDRILAMAVGSAPTAELLEMSNSPPLHKLAIRTLYHADQPTNLEVVIPDQSLLGRGGRNLAFSQHSLLISGVQLYRGASSVQEPSVYPPSEGEPEL